MSKTWEYLEKVRAEYGGEKCTPYRLSKLLNVIPTTVYRYQEGKEADDQVAMRIAGLLELPAMQVIAEINAARAEAEGKSELVQVWREAALQFGRVAFFAGAVGVAATTALDASGRPVTVENHRIMSPLL